MSAQCRAWLPYNYSLGPAKRCTLQATTEQGTCTYHKDYYVNWWMRHIPVCGTAYMSDIIMHDYKEAMLFQLQNNYVSVHDDEFYDILETVHNIDSQYILFLCKHTEFNLEAWPQYIYKIVRERFQNRTIQTVPFLQAYGDLYSYVDKMCIFDAYIQVALDWIVRNIQGVLGPAGILDAFLRASDIQYQHIAGRRQVIASYFKVLRNAHINTEDDDMRYTTCLGRYWMWVSNLKDGARKVYTPLKEELMAAAWEPKRMPYWCLDAEEVTEEYPEGLPSKSDHTAMCKKINTLINGHSHGT
jgi:hypothetical protein